MFTVEICDRDSDTSLLDISQWALEKTVSPRLSRPLTTVMTLPADTPNLGDTSFDGYPILSEGFRTIKVWQGSTLVANTPIWTWEATGDANTSQIQINGIDALIYTKGRLVQEADGTFADPEFASPISGAEIILECLQNTITNDGPLPIDLTGPIASSIDLAADLSNWPITIADLITQLTDTGALDLLLEPVDTHMGFPAGTLGRLTIADQLGSDLTGSVSFDFATGNYNVSAARRSRDLSTLCNKLWYFLGGRIDSRHYQGNITATETTPVDLSAWQALQVASQALYLTWMEVQIHDDNDAENDARPLFHKLWETEVSLRVNPRELYYATPAPGAGAIYTPFVDYNVGDTITVNATNLGPDIVAGTQRLYGFDVVEDSDGVQRVSEFLLSPDAVGAL